MTGINRGGIKHGGYQTWWVSNVTDIKSAGIKREGIKCEGYQTWGIKRRDIKRAGIKCGVTRFYGKLNIFNQMVFNTCLCFFK